MKHLLLLSLLVLSFSSCKKTEPEATDPFLGHWQALSQRLVEYDTNGQVTSDTTYPMHEDLDVTATTITNTLYRSDDTPFPSQTTAYTRIGEAFTYAGGQHMLVLYYVRSLTPTGFTFENAHYDGLNQATSRHVSSTFITYRR